MSASFGVLPQVWQTSSGWLLSWWPLVPGFWQRCEFASWFSRL